MDLLLAMADVEPEAAPKQLLKPLIMTIHTCQAQLDGLEISFRDLFDKLKDTLDQSKHVCALHCNFGHVVKGSDASLLKPISVKKNRKGRKIHGDGSSFQACLEIYIKIDHPQIDSNKLYKVKCFSTTGQIQIPGGRLDSDEDCDLVIKALIDYLNENEVGKKEITLKWKKTSMKNYKTQLIIPGDNLDLYNYRLSQYMEHIQNGDIHLIDGVYIEPPFQVRNVRNPAESPNTTFRFYVGPGKKDGFRVEVFNNEKKIDIGRINFKGTKGRHQAEAAYRYFEEIFRANWGVFIGERPKKDAPPPKKKKPRKPKNILFDIPRQPKTTPLGDAKIVMDILTGIAPPTSDYGVPELEDIIPN